MRAFVRVARRQVAGESKAQGLERRGQEEGGVEWGGECQETGTPKVGVAGEGGGEGGRGRRPVCARGPRTSRFRP